MFLCLTSVFCEGGEGGLVLWCRFVCLLFCSVRLVASGEPCRRLGAWGSWAGAALSFRGCSGRGAFLVTIACGAGGVDAAVERVRFTCFGSGHGLVGFFSESC